MTHAIPGAAEAPMLQVKPVEDTSVTGLFILVYGLTYWYSDVVCVGKRMPADQPNFEIEKPPDSRELTVPLTIKEVNL